MGEYGDRGQLSGVWNGAATPVDTTAVLAELVDEAVFRLDSDGDFVAANSRFQVLTGSTESEIVDSHISSFVVEGDVDRIGAVVRALSTQDHGQQTTLGVSLRTDWEEAIACQLSLAVVSGSGGSQGGTPTEIVGTVRPVDTADAELKRRASQQAAVATLGQLALETDDLDDLMYEATRLVSETLDTAYSKVLDLDPDRQELLLRQGVGWQEGIAGSATVESNTNSQAGYTLLSEEPVIVDDLDTETRFTGPELLTSHDVRSGISVIIGNPDEPWGILGTHDTRSRQFTDDDANFVQSVANVLASAIDRHDRTQDLKQYERIIETVNDGVYMVNQDKRFTMVNEAYCELTGYDRDELLGAPTSLVVDDEVRATVAEIEAEMVAASSSTPSLEGELRTASGESVTAEAKFALLPTDDGLERVGVVRDTSERKAYERRLETKRTKLAALDEVNTVVREITNAVLDQSTRQEIEQSVCESLAAFDSYRFAWIGEVNPRTRRIEAHAEAGTDGYFDSITVSTDPDDPLSRGPAGRAVETQEIQVTQNVFTDPDFEPWREIAEQWDYQSVAVIPITDDETLYGILGLYSDEVDAFSPEKQEIIGQLGEIVGHAITAADRKQALMSDVVTELQFEIRNVFSLFELPAPPTGKLIIDRTIPVGGGSYLQYGRATGEMVSVFETLAEQSSICESVSILEDDGPMIAFELRLSEPPVTSIVADMGGSVQQATVEDGDFRVTVHLPQTVSVRQLLDQIREEYPSTRPIARRQVLRSEIATQKAECAWNEALTDRQRATLEAAYCSGFFEWPRNCSGTEIADSMDVSAATFSQHLRAAERKLFSVLFEEL